MFLLDGVLELILSEDKEALSVWGLLTRLDETQLGAALMSRLEGGALQAAHSLWITRVNPQTMQPVTL